MKGGVAIEVNGEEQVAIHPDHMIPEQIYTIVLFGNPLGKFRFKRKENNRYYFVWINANQNDQEPIPLFNKAQWDHGVVKIYHNNQHGDYARKSKHRSRSRSPSPSHRRSPSPSHRRRTRRRMSIHRRS